MNAQSGAQNVSYAVDFSYKFQIDSDGSCAYFIPALEVVGGSPSLKHLPYDIHDSAKFVLDVPRQDPKSPHGYLYFTLAEREIKIPFQYVTHKETGERAFFVPGLNLTALFNDAESALVEVIHAVKTALEVTRDTDALPEGTWWTLHTSLSTTERGQDPKDVTRQDGARH